MIVVAPCLERAKHGLDVAADLVMPIHEWVRGHLICVAIDYERPALHELPARVEPTFPGNLDASTE